MAFLIVGSAKSNCKKKIPGGFLRAKLDSSLKRLPNTLRETRYGVKKSVGHFVGHRRSECPKLSISLRAHFGQCPSKKPSFWLYLIDFSGAGDGSRTHDLMITNHRRWLI